MFIAQVALGIRTPSGVRCGTYFAVALQIDVVVDAAMNIASLSRRRPTVAGLYLTHRHH